MGRRAAGRQGTAAVLAVVVTTFVSTTGDAAASLALVLDAARGDQTWRVTEVFLADLLPPIFLAPAIGALVDRYNARRVWLGGSLAQAALFACAAAVDGFHVRVALLALSGVLAVATGAASFALLPDISGVDRIARANSWMTTAASAAALAGPGAGGAVHTALGTGWILAFDALSFLAVAGAAAFVAPTRSAPPPTGKPLHEPTRRGLRLLRRNGATGPLLPVLAATILATAVEGVAGVFYLREVTGSDSAYGQLLSAWALGSVIGALLASWNRLDGRETLLVGGGAALMGAALLAEGLIPLTGAIAVAFLAGGLGNGTHNAGVRTLVHRHVPAADHGVAWACYRVLANTCVTTGYLLGTPGVLLGARTLIVLSGAGTLLAALYAYHRLHPSRREPAGESVGTPQREPSA
ncbi:MFS transporter [Streptomyces toxytricini]|uniref:MFS transporter n=1 Tax=Streptomyces toxytricini TaxID=67369 RepID=A0ABW8EFB3_STRT5